MTEPKAPQTTTFDADAMFEPIVITLGGKKYIIESITSKMLDQVSALAKEVEGSEESGASTNLTSVDNQLAILLGAETMDLVSVDIRKKCAVIKFLTDTIGEQLGGKALGNDESGEKTPD